MLEVPHRSREVAYPVLLDPNYVNDTTSFGEWIPGLNRVRILLKQQLVEPRRDLQGPPLLLRRQHPRPVGLRAHTAKPPTLRPRPSRRSTSSSMAAKRPSRTATSAFRTQGAGNTTLSALLRW